MPFDLARVRAELAGRRVEWFASIDSTMTVASRLAGEGCASGTIVVADEQTAGIGRHGRSWHSEPGAGLYTSIVLRLPLTPDQIPLLMLALGLAARQAIAEVSGLDPDLRWPNDVLLGGRKCAGILAQMEGSAVIAGIGINVNHGSFPAEIAALATSLRLAGSRRVAREDLLLALVNAVEHFSAILASGGAAEIRGHFTRASSYARGLRVRVEQDGGVLHGVTCGIDPSGFLLLRQDNGSETKILAGGVRPA
jgi:BirA family biotin operon repressor/biotin-[acetyl-CoA-carboxylase] ligase